MTNKKEIERNLLNISKYRKCFYCENTFYNIIDGSYYERLCSKNMDEKQCINNLAESEYKPKINIILLTIFKKCKYCVNDCKRSIPCFFDFRLNLDLIPKVYIEKIKEIFKI
jgi:hypothetical protein